MGSAAHGTQRARLARRDRHGHETQAEGPQDRGSRGRRLREGRAGGPASRAEGGRRHGGRRPAPPWTDSRCEPARAGQPGARRPEGGRRADPGDYDGLLLPGGFINPDLLRQSAPARQFVRAFAAQDKPVASLCHGPWVLASAGLLDGRTLTSWPGIRDDLVNAGATWLDVELVRDGNLTTSRGPQDMAAFVRGMLDAFAQSAPAPVTALPRTSDRQRDAPVGWAIAALRWSPKPSAAAVTGIGVAAARQRVLRNRAAQN
nr:DJ-1/PfpI family protein [Blastococcus sp. TF02A_35]